MPAVALWRQNAGSFSVEPAVWVSMSQLPFLQRILFVLWAMCIPTTARVRVPTHQHDSCPERANQLAEIDNTKVEKTFEFMLKSEVKLFFIGRNEIDNQNKIKK